MPIEPIAGEVRDLLKRTRFFEQMRSAGHDRHFLLTLHLGQRRLIQIDHVMVLTANDQ